MTIPGKQFAGDPGPTFTGISTKVTLENIVGALPQFDQLVAELEKHKLEWARLAAIHGPGGKYDDLRKTLLDTMAMYIRDAYDHQNKKVTEAQIDQEAHADLTYRNWVNKKAREHETYNQIALDMEITRAKLRHLQALIAYRTAEARL